MNAKAALLVGSLAMTALAQEPPAKGGNHEPKLDAFIAQQAKGINKYSVERERELGRWAAANLERALPIVHEPKLDAYVAQLGAALAKYAYTPFTYTLTIYEDRRPGNDPRIADLTWPARAGVAMPADAFEGQAGEPVAVAGGPVFIPLSLLAAAPDESVFAFQLAHAMAHIALRHATRQATRMDLMGMDTALRAQKPVIADVRTPANSSGAIPLGWLQFSRAFERQADYVAVRVVSQAGYSPESMAAYLSGQPAPGKGKAVFSAHPTAAERSKAIRAESGRLPAPVYTAATGGFAEASASAVNVR